MQAVQTLSRLNRTATGKEEPFVLDFVNEPEDIHAAFKPYYDRTELLEQSEPARLEELKHELDQAQIYHWSEVEAFARIFYKPKGRQETTDAARMQQQIQPAVDRFAALDEDAQRDFRDHLSAFVKMYAYLSQIIPYGDSDHELLFSYGRLLLRSLRIAREDLDATITNDVELEYYRLARMSSGSISLAEGPVEYVTSPIDVGTGRPEEERAPLSEIIEVLNDRFGTHFDEEDRFFFEQIKQRAINNEEIVQTARANSLDRFSLGIRRLIERLMIERMGENDELVTRYMSDRDFQDLAFPILAREIFDAANEPQAPSA